MVKEYFALRLEKKTKENLERAAKLDNRTPSQFVRILIEKAVDKKK